MGDATAIWFFQVAGSQIHVVDYYEATGRGAQHFVAECNARAEVGAYTSGIDFVPHDARVREFTSGPVPRQRVEVLRSLGLDVQLVPDHKLDDGINAARVTLGRCWFDFDKTRSGLEALRQYKTKFDEKTRSFSDKPEHTWASHGCLTAGQKVKTERGLVAIEDVVKGDFVWTPCGMSHVIHAGPVKRANQFVELSNDGGQFFKCTPEHKVLTGRGFVEAWSLTTGDTIWTGQEWPIRLIAFFSKAFGIGFRPAITGEPIGSSAESEPFTGRSMQQSMGQFPMGIMSTISMATSGTIRQATSRQCLGANTLAFTPASALQTDLYAPQGILLGSAQQSGTAAQQAMSGIQPTASKPGSTESGMQRLARNVVSHFARLILRAPSSATRIAELWRSDAGGESEWVYDLTVEKNACYQASGMLVSNSDAFRYLSMAWRELLSAPRPKTMREKIADLVRPKTMDEMLGEPDFME